tara:strand:+ start:2615 stop:3445 length:831 start_codon:yes stop_codon:yes gene_type:complete
MPITFEELLSRAQGLSAIDASSAFTDLFGRAQEEKFGLERAEADIQRQADARGADIIKQKRRASTAGLLGAIAGGLIGTAVLNPVLGARIGTAVGAGLGSFGGRKLSGDLSLDNISGAVKPGLFYRTAKQKVSDKVSGLNEFLQNAEDSFKRSQIVSSLGDAVTAYNLAGTKGFSKVEDLFKGDKKVAGLLNAPSMSYAGTNFNLERLIGRNPLDIGMENNLLSRLALPASGTPQGVTSLFSPQSNFMMRGSSFDNFNPSRLSYSTPLLNTLLGGR